MCARASNVWNFFVNYLLEFKTLHFNYFQVLLDNKQNAQIEAKTASEECSRLQELLVEEQERYCVILLEYATRKSRSDNILYLLCFS